MSNNRNFSKQTSNDGSDSSSEEMLYEESSSINTKVNRLTNVFSDSLAGVGSGYHSKGTLRKKVPIERNNPSSFEKLHPPRAAKEIISISDSDSDYDSGSDSDFDPDYNSYRKAPSSALSYFSGIGTPDKPFCIKEIKDVKKPPKKKNNAPKMINQIKKTWNHTDIRNHAHLIGHYTVIFVDNAGPYKILDMFIVSPDHYYHVIDYAGNTFSINISGQRSHIFFLPHIYHFIYEYVSQYRENPTPVIKILLSSEKEHRGLVDQLHQKYLEYRNTHPFPDQSKYLQSSH
jgi:hypothetical protein